MPIKIIVKPPETLLKNSNHKHFLKKLGMLQQKLISRIGTTNQTQKSNVHVAGQLGNS